MGLAFFNYYSKCSQIEQQTHEPLIRDTAQSIVTGHLSGHIYFYLLGPVVYGVYEGKTAIPFRF
jgi:hypothetical protein